MFDQNKFATENSMNVPAELKYTKEHEWVKLDGDVVTIGITDYAQGELGDVVFVEMPDIEDELEKDESFGTIEAVKAVSDLFAPLDGEVVEINEELEDEPARVNTDPYTKGWMIKVKLSDTADFDTLMTADDYKALIG
jgi:glycine cleavage system H protein